MAEHAVNKAGGGEQKEKTQTEMHLHVPDVTLLDRNGEAQHLPTLVQTQPAVLVFYRGGWCPYCRKQLAGLAAIQEQLTERGWQVIAIGPTNPQVFK